MATTYALLEWEDGYISVMDAFYILHPRKEISQYEEGEIIKAKFKGDGIVYSAIISEISDDRKHLDDKKKKKILKHRYSTVMNVDQSNTGSKSVSLHPSTANQMSSPIRAQTGEKDIADKRASCKSVCPPDKGNKIGAPTGKDATADKRASSKSVSLHPSTANQMSSPIRAQTGEKDIADKRASCKSVCPPDKGNKIGAPTGKDATADKRASSKSVSLHPSTANQMSSPIRAQTGEKDIADKRASCKSVRPPDEGNKIGAQTGKGATADKRANSASSNAEEIVCHSVLLDDPVKSSEKRKLDRAFEDIHEIQSEVRRLKRRVRDLETSVPQPETPAPRKEDISLYNGHSREALCTMIANMKIPVAITLLLHKLFSVEEITNSSISGKKTSKCGDNHVRPPLDQIKFRLLENIVNQSFPNFVRKEMIEKIQNVQKVLRKKSQS